MKITLLLTPRLVVILTACASTIVLLLMMLGFELGLRQAYEDQVANAKAHGQNLYGAASIAPANTANTPGRHPTEPAAPAASRSAP